MPTTEVNKSSGSKGPSARVWAKDFLAAIDFSGGHKRCARL